MGYLIPTTTLKLKKFKLFTAIVSFVMNLMQDRKLPIKANYLKEKIRVVHYLITSILLPRRDNLGVVIKEDMIPLWLMTHRFQTNWVDEMLLHMIYCKENQSSGLPYETLIT